MVTYYFVISCCGCDVTLRCLVLLCTAIIRPMYCNYVLHARNNYLKASHNPTISNCRRFGFRRFSLSPLWPCLLSPFRHVAVLTFAVLVCRRFDRELVWACDGIAYKWTAALSANRGGYWIFHINRPRSSQSLCLHRLNCVCLSQGWL